MNIFKIVILVFTFCMTGCGTSLQSDNDNIENLGKIIDLRSGHEISPQALIQQISAYKMILIGEKHDEVSHHQVQYWLLQQLMQNNKQGALLLEMLSVDQQPSLVALSKQLSLAQLKQAIHWNDKWNWHFYGELIQLAIQQDHDLVATNLTTQEVSTIMQGAYPLNGSFSVSEKVKEKIKALIVANHQCQYQPHYCDENLINNMVNVQQFRDRRMAEKLVRLPYDTNILIAGNHHINRRIGVPLHIEEFHSEKSVITLMLVNEQAEITHQDADFIWILP